MSNAKQSHVEATLNLDNLPAILKKEQAAAYLQVTTRYIERQVRGGRLRMYKPSRKLARFRLKDLDAFLESGASIAA